LFIVLNVMPVMAFSPPNHFGGSVCSQSEHGLHPPNIFWESGERAIHINENAAANPGVHPSNTNPGIHPSHTNTGVQPSHISTAPHEYEYGSFLGVLTVERLGRTVNVYGGATMESMDIGAGHFSFTGLNTGNIALIGHNRGRAGYFSFVRLLQEGDILTLDMGGVVRTYQVSITSIVDETDFSYLQQFGTNRLTLVTCVEYVSNQRRIVAADEI
jgi:LPXTG-site transpeptidase (sortase) family protein